MADSGKVSKRTERTTRRHALCWLGTLTLAPWWGLGAAGRGLRLGLLPVLSPRQLVAVYQPLRQYLEAATGQTVSLGTAVDFRRFWRQIVAGEYDLALLASHMARLAERDLGWMALATYTAPNYAHLILRRDRPASSLSALRGERLAVFDPLALNVMVALRWLEERGLKAGRDFSILETPGHASVAQAVLNGGARMGVIAHNPFTLLPAQTRAQLNVYADLPRIPSLVFALAPPLTAEAERYRRWLLDFPASPQGQDFFRLSPYGGVRALTAEDRRAVEPYLEGLHALLEQGS